ncbi:NlpC/P60 family protein [Pannus brasiliensis CCIBt3594]|uniref:NlpC/P60 family protein n=1 Tax=Pannus brasiliensis CCIBt3594 TaxID=1427578 RepID=A0AAW9QUE3_9CHRO
MATDNKPRVIIENWTELIITGVYQEIIVTARSYLKTPYVHQGRVKGIGIDCAGLVICVARELGLSDFDVDGYGRRSEGVEMFELFRKVCGEPIERPRPGDILMFEKGDWRHCGIFSMMEDASIIHTHRLAKACVEHRLDDYWRNLIYSAFRFPGVV